MKKKRVKIPFTAVLGDDGRATCACGHDLDEHDLLGCVHACPAEECVYGKFEDSEDIPVLT